MTLDEMRLCVAAIVPDHVTVYNPHCVYWNDSKNPITKREWLEVCRLAEQKLTDVRNDYLSELVEICPGPEGAYFATAEHRLEALCRTLHPEKFTP